MGPDEVQPSVRKRQAWDGVPEERRAIMRANRRRDTAPELALRKELHRLGLRFRVDYPIRPTGERLIRPDIVFPARRIAVYVDGCFWHGCPIHGTRSATNRGYWDEKIKTNKVRDARITAALKADGWAVFRVWEHENPASVARVIGAAARRRTLGAR